jgi:hypothetical protein
LKIDNALQATGFSRFPRTRRPFTFRQERRKSTIDYIYSRGIRVVKEEVSKVYITNHRPVRIVFEGTLPPSNFRLEKALGKAYARSKTALARFEDEITSLKLMKVLVNLLVLDFMLSYILQILTQPQILIHLADIKPKLQLN